jgi:hypothetical protein
MTDHRKVELLGYAINVFATAPYWLPLLIALIAGAFIAERIRGRRDEQHDEATAIVARLQQIPAPERDQDSADAGRERLIDAMQEGGQR